MIFFAVSKNILNVSFLIGENQETKIRPKSEAEVWLVAFMLCSLCRGKRKKNSNHDNNNND